MMNSLFSAVLLSVSVLVTGCGVSVESQQNEIASAGNIDDGYKPYVNARFTKALDSIFNQSSDSNTVWSVDVRAHGPRGEKMELYKRSSGTSVKPASTMKILTSWTAFQEISSASQIGSDKFNYIREMMKYSDNGMAENVLSWSGGVNATYSMLTQFGISRSSGLKVADGSGLSYDNRLSATDLVQLLSVIRKSDKIKAFRALLPVAGVDGTLSGRMGNINGTIAAKTGTLTTDPTTALAGYGDSKTGWQVVFAVLGDSVPSVDSGRYAIDEAMTEIINTLNYLPASAQSVATAN
jgi:D-alanyl-D-alanine carboxypeptidase